MKVLFLDCDGVINTVSNYRECRVLYGDDIDRKLFCRLATVVKRADIKVVLSTSWRYSKELVADIVSAFSEFGLNDVVVGQTPMSREADVPRADEIKAWLSGNKVTKFAIIDDDIDASFGLEANFFRTDPLFGITPEIANAIIRHFEEA
jgi:hypothetical protein